MPSLWPKYTNRQPDGQPHTAVMWCALTFPTQFRSFARTYLHPDSFKNSFSLAFILSLPYIYRLLVEVYTNRGTKVPLGNGLWRNADLGTASGTALSHIFRFELGRIWPAQACGRRCGGKRGQSIECWGVTHTHTPAKHTQKVRGN